MVKIIQTDEITLGDVIKWITKSKSLHSLQKIKAKTNKRIKNITIPKNDNPFAHIPVEQKREVLKELFVNAPDSYYSETSYPRSANAEDFNRNLQVTHSPTPKVCPVCKSKNLKLMLKDGFICLDCNSQGHFGKHFLNPDSFETKGAE